MGYKYDRKCPYKREAEGNLTTEVGEVMMEARVWRFKAGVTSQGMWAASRN